MFPEFRPVRRQQRLSDKHHFFDKGFRLRPKREFNSLPSAKKISHDWKAASLHSLEQKRRAASLDYSAMNLSNFEVGIDFGFDGGEIDFAAQEIEERAKI